MTNLKELNLRKYVRVEATPPTQYQIGGVGRRGGQIGTSIAVIGFKHASGYEVLLQFPDGKLDTFTAFDCFPVIEEAPAPEPADWRSRLRANCYSVKRGNGA